MLSEGGNDTRCKRDLFGRGKCTLYHTATAGYSCHQDEEYDLRPLIYYQRINFNCVVVVICNNFSVHDYDCQIKQLQCKLY